MIIPQWYNDVKRKFLKKQKRVESWNFGSKNYEKKEKYHS